MEALCRESVKIENGMRDLVTATRAQGRLWTEIGVATGMTKQGACHRFNKGPIRI